MSKFALLLRELRTPFLPASLISVILGSTLAYHDTGSLHWPTFIPAMLGVILIHAGANTANDYFDHLNGNDKSNTTFVRPFTGGSRMIQKGLLKPREVLAVSLSASGLGLLIGIWLALLCGHEILILGLTGIITGFFYSAPPLKLGHRGLGEITVAIDFGILPVLGSYFIQTGTWSSKALILSLPISILIAAVLFINQFQDHDADSLTGKRTGVVRLGLERSSKFHALLLLIWPIPVIFAISREILPYRSLISLICLLSAIPASFITLRHYKYPKALVSANILTILTHLATGILLSISLLLPQP